MNKWAQFGAALRPGQRRPFAVLTFIAPADTQLQSQSQPQRFKLYAQICQSSEVAESGCEMGEAVSWKKRSVQTEREMQFDCISMFEKCRGKADEESERKESKSVVSYPILWWESKPTSQWQTSSWSMLKIKSDSNAIVFWFDYRVILVRSRPIQIRLTEILTWLNMKMNKKIEIDRNMKQRRGTSICIIRTPHFYVQWSHFLLYCYCNNTDSLSHGYGHCEEWSLNWIWNNRREDIVIGSSHYANWRSSHLLLPIP